MRSPGMRRPTGSVKCSLGRVHLPPAITVLRPICDNGGITEGDMLPEQTESEDGSKNKINLPTAFNGTPRTPGFLELPVEMLAQICAYLHPLDLRSLSLTNHALRRILMSREARQMWKAAQIGTYNNMPRCPQDISEPQYTCLVFVSECFTCDAIATTIDLFNRTKSCAACHKKSHLTKAQVKWQYRKFPRELRFPPDDAAKGVERPYCKSRMKADNDSYQNIGAVDERAAYKVVLAARLARASESAKAIDRWMRGESYKQLNLQKC